MCQCQRNRLANANAHDDTLNPLPPPTFSPPHRVCIDRLRCDELLTHLRFVCRVRMRCADAVGLIGWCVFYYITYVYAILHTGYIIYTFYLLMHMHTIIASHLMSALIGVPAHEIRDWNFCGNWHAPHTR